MCGLSGLSLVTIMADFALSGGNAAAAAAIQDVAVDAEDLLVIYEEESYQAMIAAGTHTAAEVGRIRAKKRWTQEVSVCRQMIKARVWEYEYANGLCIRAEHLPGSRVE